MRGCQETGCGGLFDEVEISLFLLEFLAHVLGVSVLLVGCWFKVLFVE